MQAHSSVSPTQASQVITEFEKYALQIAHESGFTLGRPVKVTVQWDEKAISASFNWDGIAITSGFLESPLMTPDTMASVLCHELGHGREIDPTNPMALKPLPKNSPFSDVETRADYFAFGRCLPQLLKNSSTLRNMKNPKKHNIEISSEVKQKCRQHSQPKICLRLVNAIATNAQMRHQSIKPQQNHIKNAIQDADKFKISKELAGFNHLFESLKASFKRSLFSNLDYIQCRLQSGKEGLFSEKPNGCDGSGRQLLKEINRRQCEWYKNHGVVSFESFIHCDGKTFFNY